MNYPEIFKKCIAVVLKNEGGWVNDPKDAGGETNYGIADAGDGKVDGKADLDGDGTGDVAIKQLTRDQAIEAYYNRYWRKMRLQNIHQQEAILQIFDFGINAGMRTAIRIAQKISGATVDGLPGSETTTRINEYPGDFLADYKQARREYYHALVRHKPENERFVKGWLKRVDNTHF